MAFAVLNFLKVSKIVNRERFFNIIQKLFVWVLGCGFWYSVEAVLSVKGGISKKHKIIPIP
jgi:hypothetical protein